jgi:hypothetical protein
MPLETSSCKNILLELTIEKERGGQVVHRQIDVEEVVGKEEGKEEEVEDREILDQTVMIMTKVLMLAQMHPLYLNRRSMGKLYSFITLIVTTRQNMSCLLG